MDPELAEFEAFKKRKYEMEAANKKRKYEQSGDDRYCTVLLFPKEFEMKLFLNEAVKKKHTINNSVFQNKRCILLTLNIDGTDIYETFYVFCMGESDIAFSFRLGKLLREIDMNNLHIVLCGTAGGSHTLKHKLGEVFRVNKAIKIDRGVLNVNSNDKIEMEFNKSVESFCSDHSLVADGVTTTCSNHILNIDPVDLVKYGLKNHGIIVDMETHEFFATCELEKVWKYDCLRLVSDISSPDMKKFAPEVAYEINRLTRKTKVKFSKLVDRLINLSIESISVRKEKKVVPISLSKQKDADVLAQNIADAIAIDRKAERKRHADFINEAVGRQAIDPVEAKMEIARAEETIDTSEDTDAPSPRTDEEEKSESDGRK